MFGKKTLILGLLALRLSGLPDAHAFTNMIETNHPLVPREMYLLKTCTDFVRSNRTLSNSLAVIRQSTRTNLQYSLDECIAQMGRILTTRPDQEIFIDREAFLFHLSRQGDWSISIDGALGWASTKMFFPNEMNICFPDSNNSNLQNRSITSFERQCMERIARDIPREFLAVSGRQGKEWSQIEREMAANAQRIARETAEAERIARENAQLTAAQREAAEVARRQQAEERAREEARIAAEQARVAAAEAAARAEAEAAELAERKRIEAENSFPNRMRRYGANLSATGVGVGAAMVVGGELLARNVDPLTTSRLFTTGSSGVAVTDAQARSIVEGIERLERSSLSRYLPGELAGGEVTIRADYSVVDAQRGAERVRSLAGVGDATPGMAQQVRLREIPQPQIVIAQPSVTAIAPEAIRVGSPDLTPGSQVVVSPETLAQRVVVEGPPSGPPLVTQTQGLLGGTTTVVNSVEPPVHPAVSINNPQAVAEAKRLLAEMEARFGQLRLELSTQLSQEQLALRERISQTRAMLAELEGKFQVNVLNAQAQIATADASRYSAEVNARISGLQNDMRQIEQLAQASIEKGRLYERTAPTFSERSFRLSRVNATDAVAAELSEFTRTGAVVREIRWQPVAVAQGLRLLGRGVSIVGAVDLGLQLIPPALADQVCSDGVNCYGHEVKSGSSREGTAGTEAPVASEHAQ